MNPLHLDDETGSFLVVIKEYPLCRRCLIDFDIGILHGGFEERRLGAIPRRSNRVEGTCLRPISDQIPGIGPVDGANANLLEPVLQREAIVEHMVAVGNLEWPSWGSEYTLVVLDVELWVDFGVVRGCEVDAPFVEREDIVPSPVIILDRICPHLHGSDRGPMHLRNRSSPTKE